MSLNLLVSYYSCQDVTADFCTQPSYKCENLSYYINRNLKTYFQAQKSLLCQIHISKPPIQDTAFCFHFRPDIWNPLYLVHTHRNTDKHTHVAWCVLQTQEKYCWGPDPQGSWWRWTYSIKHKAERGGSKRLTSAGQAFVEFSGKNKQEKHPDKCIIFHYLLSVALMVFL